MVIVDTADDLNSEASNALLKTIEEPPPAVVFLILAHRPARLLATIKSRCRRLMLSRLVDDDMGQVLAKLAPDSDAGLRSRITTRADGSPGRALRMIAGDMLQMIEEFEALLHALPTLDHRDISSFSEKFERQGQNDQFSLFRATLSEFMARHVREISAQDNRLSDAAMLASEAVRLEETFAMGDVFNLGKRHLVMSGLESLRDVLRRSANTVQAQTDMRRID